VNAGSRHPAVLARAGLDPERWSGLAMGLGLDRLVMLDKGIDDIRLLRATDPRVAAQCWIARRIGRSVIGLRSVAISPSSWTRLTLSKTWAIASALRWVGRRKSSRRSPFIAQTPYAELPEAARERMRLGSSQKNVLVRVALRHVSETLTHERANDLRDRVYAAIHRGPVSEWASRDAESTTISMGLRRCPGSVPELGHRSAEHSSIVIGLYERYDFAARPRQVARGEVDDVDTRRRVAGAYQAPRDRPVLERVASVLAGRDVGRQPRLSDGYPERCAHGVVTRDRDEASSPSTLSATSTCDRDAAARTSRMTPSRSLPTIELAPSTIARA